MPECTGRFPFKSALFHTTSLSTLTRPTYNKIQATPQSLGTPDHIQVSSPEGLINLQGNFSNQLHMHPYQNYARPPKRKMTPIKITHLVPHFPQWER
jgi:hypothetical protein